MRALIQRVTQARVLVDEQIVGEIGEGLCCLIGVAHHDDRDAAVKLADKLWRLRVFSDANGRMNLSVAEHGGEILVVSQFTLYADTSRGRRPSYVAAAAPDHAAGLIDILVTELNSLGAAVSTGSFGAHMTLELINDGPVTIMLDT